MTVVTPELPCHRAIVAVDVEGSTGRTNPEKVQMRRLMYELVEQALDEAGISEHCRDPLIDRGDGILALIHPVDHAPKTLLLTVVVPTLSRLLAEHGLFRLRAVVHAGEVHFDDRGCFGEAVDVACRLLDAEPAKEKLRQVAAPLVLVVSDEIHRNVVRHGYDGIDVQAYEPLVQIDFAAGYRHTGWVTVPALTGMPATQLRLRRVG